MAWFCAGSTQGCQKGRWSLCMRVRYRKSIRYSNSTIDHDEPISRSILLKYPLRISRVAVGVSDRSI